MTRAMLLLIGFGMVRGLVMYKFIKKRRALISCSLVK